MTDVGSDIFQIGHNHYLVMDDRYSICCNAHTGYYKIEIATLMPPTNYLWATKANMDTGQVQITFGPEEPTRVQVKSYHLWATKSNQRIKTDIGPQYRAEFDEFCNFNARTRIHQKDTGVRQAN